MTLAYPEPGSNWVDNKNVRRHLEVTELEPGDRLGREIRGLERLQADGVTVVEQPYATDHRTFHAVWGPT